MSQDIELVEGEHYIVTTDLHPLLKKNFSVILTRLPSDQYPEVEVFCNNGTFQIDPKYLVKAQPVKRFLVFGDTKNGGWKDYLGSFHLIEEAEKSMGLYKIAKRLYSIIDSYTGVNIL